MKVTRDEVWGVNQNKSIYFLPPTVGGIGIIHCYRTAIMTVKR
jgi:hypothetical protein